MDMQLDGRTALVTGGSKGIGKAIARGLAREGVDVAIVARGREQLEATAAELAKETGRRFVPIVADASNRADVERAVAQAADALGHIDILVNNAGFPGGLSPGPLPEVSDDLVLEDLNVKTLGYLRFAKAVAPYMQRQNWGRIICIGGLSARTAGTYSAGMRNIAIAHMTRTLSAELGPSGITVNLVHPGATRTEATTQAQAEAMARQNMTGRVIDASEIAHLAVFLASPLAAAISGEIIGVGGGEPRRSVFI